MLGICVDGLGLPCYTLSVMIRSCVVALLFLLTAACGAPTVAPTATAAPSPTASTTATVEPSPTAVPATATATATPVPPTATPTPSATATSIPPTATRTGTPTPSATPTALPDDLWLGPSDLRIHPDGEQYYSGDLISFQVYAHRGQEWTSSELLDVGVEIWLGESGESIVIAEDRVAFHENQDGQVRWEWVWDTTGLTGSQTITVALDPDDEIQIGDEDPDNNVVTRTIDLQPRDEISGPWAGAHWAEQSSDCCVFHYITGTAAERDIQQLMDTADEAIAFAGQRLGVEADQSKLDVYLINRVLGHGGFAGDALILSYLDRFYAGGDWTQVFRHEGTHVLDRQLAQVRPTLLTEGLAVYVSGGHFREEPFAERAAALLALDRYIPLPELADNFYPSQHETGYLEAASFVDYLIDRFGWERFKAFYGGIPKRKAGQAALINAGLQEHFGLTLKEAESDWLATLRGVPVVPTQVTDLRLTIRFYETVRRYQRDWDPSAYFLGVWLPAPEEAERRGITADFVRHPADLINVTLETMFVAADRAIDEGRYAEAGVLLDAISAVLDAGGDLQSAPLANQYRTLVEITAAADYEAQQISLDLRRNVAHVVATEAHGADVVELSFVLRAGAWELTPMGN